LPSDTDSCFSIWQAKRQEELRAIIEKERTSKEELITAARREVATFMDNRAKALAIKKEKNRYNLYSARWHQTNLIAMIRQSMFTMQVIFRLLEKEFRSDLETVMEHGTLWEKVAKLVDLKAKSGKDEVSTSRMRNLLIQLKSNPTS
jgi:translation initiation factor 2B subunit (eIF-2B alpha/beta/delta family)